MLGLEKGRKYKLRVRMYGDTTRGVRSCGEARKNEDEDDEEAICAPCKRWRMGRLKRWSRAVAETFFVWDIIGRALCIKSGY